MENYNPLDIKLKYLDINFIVDYNLESWIVKGGTAYDLEDQKAKLFLLNSGKDDLYLFYGYNNKLFLFNEVNIKAVDRNFPGNIDKTGIPPGEILYNEKKYFLDKEIQGAKRDISSNIHDWSRAVIWFYESEDMKDLIFIQQTAPNEFSAYIGTKADELDFSNIIPAGKA